MRQKVRDQWGVIDYMPLRKDGMDDEAIEVARLKLFHEERRIPTQRNKKLIDHLMDQTHAKRREMMVKERKTVAELGEQYPVLFSVREVRCWFDMFLFP